MKILSVLVFVGLKFFNYFCCKANISSLLTYETSQEIIVSLSCYSSYIFLIPILSSSAFIFIIVIVGFAVDAPSFVLRQNIKVSIVLNQETLY